MFHANISILTAFYTIARYLYYNFYIKNQKKYKTYNIVMYFRYYQKILYIFKFKKGRISNIASIFH